MKTPCILYTRFHPTDHQAYRSSGARAPQRPGRPRASRGTPRQRWQRPAPRPLPAQTRESARRRRRQRAPQRGQWGEPVRRASAGLTRSGLGRRARPWPGRRGVSRSIMQDAMRMWSQAVCWKGASEIDTHSRGGLVRLQLLDVELLNDV